MAKSSIKAAAQSTAKPDAAVTLAAAPARLAQWALAVYVGTAIVIGALLVAAVVTEMAHDEDQLEGTLRSAAVDHSYTLRRYLDLLTSELSRLGSRSEIQSGDNDDSPERKLLELSHKGSTLFDAGVAILDRDGTVVWSEPRTFLGQGASLASEPWFAGVSHTREASVVPVSSTHSDSLLYVVAPALQGDSFGGVVLGAIDLDHRALARTQDGLAHATTLITRRDGRVVYPRAAPDITQQAAYKQFFTRPLLRTETARLSLVGEPYVLAAAPLPGTELVYVLMSDEKALFGKARQRLAVRLVLGVALVVPPLWMLVLVLRRALRVFRQSEQEAVERERLQLLADASNLIAHEVRNALNGLGVGLDLLLQGDRGSNESRQSRIVRQLRDEMTRLKEFTGELMLFSKGIVPHPVRLDLADCVPKLTELSLELATEAGCAIDVQVDKTPVWAYVDPALLRVVLGNLIGNALDVLAAKADPKPGTVRISLDASEREAKLRVVDDGPGIPDDLRRHLFEPFQTTKPSGTGLGLALSRRIARAHGGDLVLESSKSGASFLLTLPSEAAP